ncbi:hypothetical protein BXU11_03270 [Flavobacterium sp. LM5]|jgi:hypothetical protein|uniref:DUF3127 domain-containing protein n=1 Tax=Flavobacterium sp. LM5 TaxID=1938610 RepID=UPI000993B227|nr:DUF3127 domain-containing protein [Flavobacterium sp. LM5]OOV28966.1 hypothetical protein BXU11_03270 [Flavobacterium sp. LM5]
MEVLGKVKVINPVQQVSASFKKREVVVITDEQYPQHISIEFQQDKTDLLNSYAVGEPVKVSINLRGREWVSPQGEVRHFNTIVGWRIEKQAPVAAAAPTQAPPMPTPETFAPATNFNEEEADDLPF